MRICLLWLALSLPCLADPVGIQVTRIIDGDTLAARIGGKGKEIKIRLDGIDAPEGKQPFSKAATKALGDFLKGKKCTFDKIAVGFFGRDVGRVYADGKDASLYQVKNGFAWWYVKFAKKDEKLKAAQASAKKSKAGLWKEPNQIPPWEYRKKKK